VDRVGNDYPRLVALSHPQLRPEVSTKEIIHYSQHYVDLIDLEANDLVTLPISEVLDRRYPALRFLAQVHQDGYLAPLRTSLVDAQEDELVLTFDGFLARTPFPDRMRTILQLLEKHYRMPVDMEFTLQVHPAQGQASGDGRPAESVVITVLQCRPQSALQERRLALPKDLNPEDVVFSTQRVVPCGFVRNIRYVLFVSPEGYHALPTEAMRIRLRGAIGSLNAALAEEVFICVGPGRWGTNNADLGVRVGYGDIYHARALVELSGEGIGLAPEFSFGTHFFQDLIESQIYPLAIYQDDQDVVFQRPFFYETPNLLLDYLPGEAELEDTLRIIDVESYRPGQRLHLIMDDEAGQAVALLRAEDRI
jgi:hypothetical protein